MSKTKTISFKNPKMEVLKCKIIGTSPMLICKPEEKVLASLINKQLGVGHDTAHEKKETGLSTEEIAVKKLHPVKKLGCLQKRSLLRNFILGQTRRRGILLSRHTP